MQVGIDHGGRLADARRAFPLAALPWIDLSTGINPWPYPVDAPTAADWARLPEPDAGGALETAMAAAWGVDPSRVVAVPGSEVALRLIALMRGRASVGIVSPTYASHADAWSAEEPLQASLATLLDRLDDLDVMVVARPNNPDGVVVEEDALAQAAGRLAAWGGGRLVIDEAFADAMPGGSLADRPWAASALVLRSFGKFFGLAGLRLGALIAPPPLAGRVRALLGDWRVSGPAVAIGRRAYADGDWQERMRGRLAATAGRMDLLLAAHGFAAQGACPLFRLIDSPRAGALHRHLAARGIWTRAFAERPDWLRLGLPGDQVAWARLDEALEEFGDE